MRSILRATTTCRCPASRPPCTLPLPSRPSLRLRPNGVLTSGLTTNSQSFRKRHQEVAEDSEWYGPEAPDHSNPPAAAIVSTAPVTNRSDVRLITGFAKYLKSHKLDLSAMFPSEALLSADSGPVCDLQSGHHGELLAEFLTSGNLRVGEELPHWFVNGNLRGAIKAWMATRPAAAALAAAGAAASAALVDPLLASMPTWSPSSVAELGGWEPGRAATAEDVALLHTLGALAYGARLDCGEFLQQLCGTDPFVWVDAQVAGGAINEPQPWLLETFFMSRHAEGEALPLWFATWGVREKLGAWLQGPKAAAFASKLLAARRVAVEAGAAGAAAPSA